MVKEPKSSVLSAPPPIKLPETEGIAEEPASAGRASEAPKPTTSSQPEASRATGEYLRTAEVADLLHVSSKTISRWAREGKLPSVRTLGGHRRFPEQPIRDVATRLSGEALDIRDHDSVS